MKEVRRAGSDRPAMKEVRRGGRHGTSSPGYL
jgi:hypothetical protein